MVSTSTKSRSQVETNGSTSEVGESTKQKTRRAKSDEAVHRNASAVEHGISESSASQFHRCVVWLLILISATIAIGFVLISAVFLMSNKHEIYDASKLLASWLKERASLLSTAAMHSLLRGASDSKEKLSQLIDHGPILGKFLLTYYKITIYRMFPFYRRVLPTI